MKRITIYHLLLVFYILVSFTNCSQNESIILYEDMQIEEDANYGVIDAVLSSEEQFFLDALKEAKTIHGLDSILSQQNPLKTRSTETNNKDLEISEEEGQIFQDHIDRYRNEIDFALDKIPDDIEPTDDDIKLIICSVRDEYIGKVDELNLSTSLKIILKEKIYYKNGLMEIIVDNTDEIYNLALATVSGEMQTRGWLSKLWNKIKMPLKCTLYTVAAVSGSSTPLAGVGYGLAGLCWIGWITSVTG